MKSIFMINWPLVFVFIFGTVFFLFWKKKLSFWLKIFLSLIISLAIYYAGLLFKWWWTLFSAPLPILRKLFLLLSSTTAQISYFVLKLFYPQVSLDYFDPTAPALSLKNFRIVIAVPCSGLESLFLFSSLFALICLLQRKRINLKKALKYYLCGLLGMFLLNALRIVGAVLIGAYLGQDLAFKAFHDNVSWIVFIIYFFVFWSVVSSKVKQ